MPYVDRASGLIDGEVDLQKVARAVIAAMREPTEAMLRAGAEADIPGGRIDESTFRESRIDTDDAPIIWHAMIDEALK